ncbi:uncharacterized protein LOC120621970 [Pteropus medius]|uniref:uncharacterized protein LOC120621970 n=1 Tax=Pteropus vampyrus TaxID=132908 RepID=UPI00196A80DD|nr:uncharacterized protein LOC120621970 [Pteropus giganteus]
MEAEAIVTARGTGRWSPQQTEQRCHRSRHRPPGLCVPLRSLGSAYSPQRHGAAPEATGGTVVASRVGGGGSRGCGFITGATAAWGPKAISLNVAWNQNRNFIFGTEPIEPRGRHSALELEESRASWNWTRGGPVYTASLPGSDSGSRTELHRCICYRGSPPTFWEGHFLYLRALRLREVTQLVVHSFSQHVTRVLWWPGSPVSSSPIPLHHLCPESVAGSNTWRRNSEAQTASLEEGEFIAGRAREALNSTKARFLTAYIPLQCPCEGWDRSFQKVIQRSIGCG